MTTYTGDSGELTGAVRQLEPPDRVAVAGSDMSLGNDVCCPPPAHSTWSSSLNSPR